MVQTGCNLRCKYCYADGGEYGCGRRHLAPEQAVEYVSALIKGQVRKIGTVFFFGGEPAAFPKTINAVCGLFSELCELGEIDCMPMFTMVSNGTYCSELLVDTIKKYGIKLTLSIDGPKDIHDQLRVTADGKGTFDTVYRNLQKLKAAGIDLNLVESTYTNLHEKIGYSAQQIKAYIRSIAGDVKVLAAPCEGDYSPAAYDASEGVNADECLNGIDLAVIQTLLHNGCMSSFLCESGASSVCLLCDGTLYPCHRFLPDTELLPWRVQRRRMGSCPVPGGVSKALPVK